jgi:threonylcarbamoyladenosine tRNA methylthiotransferase MtaB
MKIYLDTIGCRLNQSEIETFAQQFQAAGHLLVPDPAEADLAVINTCTVTAAAAADSRKKIRRMGREGIPQVVVTGCWSTLEPHVAVNLNGVTRIIPNSEKDGLVPLVLDISPEAFDLEPLIREPIPGARLRTRAFIKVQDGCDNRCTFCVTTIARGPGRSHTMDAVIKDIQAALVGGAKEIVLTGVHMGSWGCDLGSHENLASLVDSILSVTDTPRLRLSSLEPWDIDPDFFNLWDDRRLARHLHLPLQSGCGATLKRMARKITPAAYAHLLETARSAIPGVAITTDVIVGFPGETEAEFAENLAFIKEMNFARGHVFTYSERPGTAAACMPGSVPYPTRKSRSAKMRLVFGSAERAYMDLFLGHQLPVLWESATALDSGGWRLTGLTGNYLRVFAVSTEKLWNQIDLVKLTGINGKGLDGQIESVEESSR